MLDFRLRLLLFLFTALFASLAQGQDEGHLSTEPADYDLESAEIEFRQAKGALEQQEGIIAKKRAAVGSNRREISRLRKQNELYGKNEPDHPLVAKNQERIALLEETIETLQLEISSLESALPQLRETKAAAELELSQVRDNRSRAEAHFERLAQQLARVAEAHATDRGAFEGARAGAEAGEREGYLLGRELGIYRARELAIERGSASGNIEGTSAGASDALQAAYETAEPDGWEAAAYATAMETFRNAPLQTDPVYQAAFQHGLLRAQNDANSHYFRGIEEADSIAAHQPLAPKNNAALEYNPDAAPWLPQPRNPVELPPHAPQTAPEQLRRMPPLEADPTSEPLELLPVERHLEPPYSAPNFDPYAFRPRSVPRIQAPTPRLAAHFETCFLHCYEDTSRDAYERSYLANFEESFFRHAEQQVTIFSEPHLYSQFADESEQAAFEYAFEDARTSTFNREYPKLYDEIFDRATASPNLESAAYKKAYQIGRYNAHLLEGDREGYAAHISDFQSEEKARGFSERQAYIQSNAVLSGIRFQVTDENQDGIFAINEPFQVAVEVKNLGLATQGEEQAGVKLRILEGPAEVLVSKKQLPVIAPQSQARFEEVLSGKIAAGADRGDRIVIRVEFIEFGQVSSSQDYTLEVRYPLELSLEQSPERLFSNQENRILAELSNATTKPTPNPLAIALRDNGGNLLASYTQEPIEGGAGARVDLQFLMNEAAEFSRQELSLEILSGNIVQLRYRLPTTLVSKRYSHESELLLVIPSLSNFDLAPMKHALALQGAAFDLYAYDQETDTFPHEWIGQYIDGYVIADAAYDYDPDTANALQNHFQSGGSLFVAAPDLSGDETWTPFLDKVGVKASPKQSTQALLGLWSPEGNEFPYPIASGTQLTFKSPYKQVIAYPLFRSEKRRGLAGPSYHGARILHPENLNTLSLASFSLSALQPEDLARLAESLLLAQQGFEQALDNFSEAASPAKALKQAGQIKTQLIEANALASRLNDSDLREKAAYRYNARLNQFSQFVRKPGLDPSLKPHLAEIVSELSKQRQSRDQRAILKELRKVLD